VLPVVRFAERHFDDRQQLDLLVPDEAHVQLSALDQLLDDRRLAELLMDELHALRQVLVILHDGRLGDPHRRVLEQRLHDQRKPQLRGAYWLLPLVTLGERRDPDPVVREDLLRERLVPGDQQGRGRGAGVAVPVHLEHGREAVLVPRVPSECLAAVEDDLRLELREALEHRLELLGDPDHQDVVPLRHQGAGHVVLRLLDLGLHRLLVVGILPVRVESVEENRDFHRASLPRPVRNAECGMRNCNGKSITERRPP